MLAGNDDVITIDIIPKKTKEKNPECSFVGC